MRVARALRHTTLNKIGLRRPTPNLTPRGKQLYSGISYTITGIFPESCWNSRILSEFWNLERILESHSNLWNICRNPGILLESLESFRNPRIFSEFRNLVRILGILSESLFLPKFQNIIGIPEIFSKSGSPESFHNLYRIPESRKAITKQTCQCPVFVYIMHFVVFLPLLCIFDVTLISTSTLRT